MEILLVLLIGGGILYYLYRKMSQPDSMDLLNASHSGTPTVPPMPEPQPAPVAEEVKRTLDVNNDGKVDLADVKEAVKKTRARVKKAADLDGDGRVTVKDVKVAATRARKTANAVADKAARAATKSRAKK
jgi:hypothetical protein